MQYFYLKSLHNNDPFCLLLNNWFDTPGQIIILSHVFQILPISNSTPQLVSILIYFIILQLLYHNSMKGYIQLLVAIFYIFFHRLQVKIIKIVAMVMDRIMKHDLMITKFVIHPVFH